MSCFNPRLMASIDLQKYPLLRPRFQELGWKVNQKTGIAYRLVSKETRDLVLETIPDYVQNKVFDIPCGGCVACRLDYAKDWANRCSLEALQYDCNYFITFSYDEDHVVKGPLGNNTIVKEHIDTFIHSLRKHYLRKYNHTGIRVFGCQEYGDKSMRPHAHIIFFNLPIDDLTIDFPQPDGTFVRKKEKSTGRYYWFSKTIQDLWKYGYVVIADANWNTEAYVSRYVMKKQKGVNASVYEDKLCIVPPYLFMSRRPGIGMQYFQDNYIKHLAEPYLILSRPYKSPLISGLPRAFKKTIQKEDPKAYQQLCDAAKEDGIKAKSLITIPINQYRSISEARTISKGKVFSRDNF